MNNERALHLMHLMNALISSVDWLPENSEASKRAGWE
jgi:hypothetical protein